MQPTLRANQDAKPFLPHILVMEDELSVAKGLETVLTEEGYAVDLAMSGEEALTCLSERRFNLLVADLRLPDRNGIDVIKEVKERWPDTEVVVITGYPSVDTAVSAMKLGSKNYLPKPFGDDEIIAAIDEALSSQKDLESSQIIQKNAVARILNRTVEDQDFWNALMDKGSEALEAYPISSEAKAAIISGDLSWIEKHIGRLPKSTLKFIYKRLEREVW